MNATVIDTREYVIQLSENSGETWRHAPGHAYVSPLQAIAAAGKIAADKRNAGMRFRVIEVRQTWTVAAEIGQPATDGPSDTCSVCGKEECANEVCGTEPPAVDIADVEQPRASRLTSASVACPVHKVKLTSGAVEPKCPHVHGNVEYGVFEEDNNGSLQNYDCAYSAANAAAVFATEAPNYAYTVRRVCNEHPDEPADTCGECSA